MFGKIAGGVGALLALTSVLSLLVSGDPTIFAFKLGVGVVLVVLWAITDRERLTSWAKTGFFYGSSVGLTLVFIALLVGVNFIVARRGPTWDLTRKKIFTLALQTTETLKALKTPVKAIAFAEDVLPEGTESLLRRYALENDHFTWEARDPRRNPDLVEKFGVRKGQAALVLVEQDERGAFQVVNLARLADPRQGEQELTTGLTKLNSVGQQKLYFTSGHGEWPLTPLGASEEEQRSAIQAKRPLEDEGYLPSELNLIEAGGVPLDASAVVVAGARSTFSPAEIKSVEVYLAKGGRLLFFTEPGAQSGLEPLLETWGLEFEPGLVADTKMNADQPFVVATPFLGEHEITRPLARQRLNVIFATTRAITLLKQGLLPGVTTSPLVLTTPYAWVETTPTEHPVNDSSERSGTMVLAAAATRPADREPNHLTAETRIAAFGDSELLSGMFGYEPNRNLVLNAVAWVTQQGQKITIRPPDRDMSTIDLTPQMLSTIRLVAMDVLPTLLIGLGLTVLVVRRAR